MVYLLYVLNEFGNIVHKEKFDNVVNALAAQDYYLGNWSHTAYLLVHEPYTRNYCFYSNALPGDGMPLEMLLQKPVLVALDYYRKTRKK